MDAAFEDPVNMGCVYWCALDKFLSRADKDMYGAYVHPLRENNFLRLRANVLRVASGV